MISFDLGSEYITREYLAREETMKMAYANIPQGEVGRLLNQQGVIATDKYIRQEGLNARLNLQEHDAVVLSVPRGELYQLASFISQSLTVVRKYKLRSVPEEPLDDGVELSIPVDITVSKHWKCGCKQCKLRPVLEFGSLPTEDIFYYELDCWEARLARIDAANSLQP